MRSRYYPRSAATLRRIIILILQSKAWSVIYGGIIPLAVIVAWAALLRPDAHFAQVTILGLLAALALSSFLTDIIKNAVGRPRPDLLSRCKPEKGTPEYELVTFSVCSETNQHILHEGWRSFPSGHSSFAFGGLGYLGLYVILHSLNLILDMRGARAGLIAGLRILHQIAFLQANCMRFDPGRTWHAWFSPPHLSWVLS